MAGVGFYLVGRLLGLNRFWALTGAAFQGVCPLFLFMVFQVMSDALGMVWVTATLYLALRSREHWSWGFCAGFAFGLTVLIRPANAILLFPALIALSFRPTTWAAFFLGGLPLGITQALYNHSLYGAVFSSGYGGIGYLFSIPYAQHNAVHFALWIPLLLTPLVAIPGFAFLLFRKPSRTALVLGSWIFVYLAFYVFYFHSGETWWYLRFILPAFPAIVIAGLLFWQTLLERARSQTVKRSMAAGLISVTLGMDYYMAKHLHVTSVKANEESYPIFAQWARATLPPNAILLQMQTSGAITYYTDFTVIRWDMISPAGWRDLQQAAHKQGRPIYATLFAHEQAPAFTNAIQGRWEKVFQIKPVGVWRLIDEVKAD
jgi:hypothetical protein